jgi:acetyl esterase
MLREEGEADARKLIQAGVPVTVLRYLETIHQFVMLNPVIERPAARAAVAPANGTLRGVCTRC